MLINLINIVTVFLIIYLEVYLNCLQNQLQISLIKHLTKLFQKLVFFIDTHNVIAQFHIKAGATSCNLPLCLYVILAIWFSDPFTILLDDGR